ncbi:MAG TPA: TauD/TfdA family dioxygenase [Candidatus Angelobacter sp.]
MPEGRDRSIDLRSFKRTPIKSSAELIRIGPLFKEGLPPVLVEALESLNLATWAENNLPLIEDLLKKHGGILFRKFGGEGQEGMQRFVTATRMEVMNYMEGATPRKALGGNVYTSTEFPSEQMIALHNENSYVMSWPMKVCFGCVVEPVDRGETPIADVREVLKRITPSVRRRFEEKGYMLARTFSQHLGLPWKESFKVSSKDELENYCRKARIEFEWTDEDRLKTKQVRPAIATHPWTHEQVWFNHIAFWHVSSLEKGLREQLLASYSPDEIPYNTYYGDGSLIEDGVVEELRQAYDSETVKFTWKRGDLLLLDNMLVAHGRSPYSGPRKIIVTLAQAYTRTDI